MKLIRNMLSHFPRLKRMIKAGYCFLRGEPQISYSQINKELIQKCVSKPDPIILEIGCNSGGHTLWFADMFENANIFCFEPDPRAIARFKKKVGQHPNISLFEMALSDRNGEIIFYQSNGHHNEKQLQSMPEGYDLSGSIRKPKDHLIVHPWLSFEQQIKVKTSTLDSWCEKHSIDIIDFIWMDVQGAELDVLKGAEKSLRRTRFIYTEYSNKELYEGQAPLKQLLKQLHDFKVLVRYPGDVLLWNTKFELLPEEVLKHHIS